MRAKLGAGGEPAALSTFRAEMSFDQNSDLPLIQPHKRTTKVNFAIVVGVLLFFVITGAVLFWFHRNPDQADPPAATSMGR